MTLSIAARASDDLSRLDLQSLMQMNITLTTAQKRTEDVERVPIAMTIIKADMIKGVKLDTNVDLQSVAPGLQTSGSAGFVMPFIRGVGNFVNANGIEPSVALYVDGVYQSDRAEMMVDLSDAEQIEILRGPQGTLYGRNATGGAINVTTRGPSDRLESSAAITAGNLDLKDANAFVTGPLVQGVRASFSAHVRDRDGYYTNIVDGSHVNDERYYSLNGRVQMDLGSTADAEVLLKFSSHDENLGYVTAADLNSIPAKLGALVTTRPYQAASDRTEIPNRSDYATTALKLHWDTPWVCAHSISARTDERHRFGVDVDASSLPLRSIDVHENAYAFTQELQFSPVNKMDRLDWLIGAFYIDRSGGVAPYEVALTVPNVGFMTRSISANVGTKAYALFGESTFSLTPAFSLTAGLRYNSEEKTLEDVSIEGTGIPKTLFPNHSRVWDTVTHRLVAKYATESAMVYAKTETGFRSGNYNTYNAISPGPVQPEHVTMYELGVKTKLPGLPLHLQGAAFFNDYRNLQVQVVDTASSGSLLEQAPKAETYGFDGSFDWKATERFNVGAGFEWVHARYREFVSSGILVPNPAGGNTLAPNLDLAGKHLSFAPELTGNFFASYSHPLPTGELIASGNYYYSSRVYFEPSNSYSQRAFAILNASLAYRSAAHWEASLWARNLTDTVYVKGIAPTDQGAFSVYAEPRTYGVTLEYSFGR